MAKNIVIVLGSPFILAGMAWEWVREMFLTGRMLFKILDK